MNEATREPGLQVVATAGHVDHGKSALILRLTGTDPDRLAEEKRRGLTIDLGFAWCTLPSGHEVGFVDVPGHERFVRNMLAGVGPVRLILFVVAADEGWKPQTEEHLAIVDVLGAHGGVVALTKADLVDAETLEIAAAEVRERLAGTALASAPIVRVSAVTGEGLEDLRSALDEMIAAAPPPAGGDRPRQFIDRVFTIRGAGTVVTGTLTGGDLAVGEEAEIYPTRRRARIRGLQSHKRPLERARPVSRVAVNLTGTEREALARGDVLGLAGQWRATRLFEARVRPVRSLAHPLSSRGAYKLYAGSAERDARIRFYAGQRVAEPDGAFARIRLAGPLVLDFHDRFVLREAGRRETVAGGVVLDIEPPTRPGPDVERRLRARETAAREDLPSLLISERDVIRDRDLAVLAGTSPEEIAGAVRVGSWWVAEERRSSAEAALRSTLDAFHLEHPLQPGADLALARATVEEAFAGARAGPGLVDSLIDEAGARGIVAREGSTIRLASHEVTLAGREEEVERLVAAVRDGEPTPPTVADLVAFGFPREVIDAAARGGTLVRVSADLVMTGEFVARAEAVLRESGDAGITVGAFREALGTTRKYALPLLEHFDARGVTRREGDLRVLRR